MKSQTVQLVERAMQGDKHAFCSLVSKHQSAVYGLAFHYLKNFADAEDVAQEVFLTAYQQLGTLKSPEKFASWLNGITVNLCKMWLRRRRELVSIDEITQREEYTLFEDAQIPTPDEVCEQQELHEQVMEAIAKLPEPNRIVLTLCYIDGLSYKEIGDFLSVPIGTVRSRLHRAKKMLKEEMVSLAEEMFGQRKLSEEFTKKISDKIRCPHCQKEFSFDDLRIDKPEDAPKDIQDDTKAHLEKTLAVLERHSKRQDVEIEQAQADALKEIASFGVMTGENGRFRTQITVVDGEERYLYHECQSFIGTIRNRAPEQPEGKEGWFILSLFRNMGRETLWRYSHFPAWDWYVLVEGHWYLYPNPYFQGWEQIKSDEAVTENLEFGELESPFNEVVFVDEFDQPVLRADWNWIDPNDDCTKDLSAKPGWLKIIAPEDNDLYPPKDMDGPRLLVETSGDFAIETKVVGIGNERFAGGLLIWADENNFIRFERGTHGWDRVRVEANIDGEYKVLGRWRLRSESVFLRIERKDKKFAPFLSEDGNKWAVADIPTLPANNPLFSDTIRVGLHAIGPFHGSTTTYYNFFKIVK